VSAVSDFKLRFPSVPMFLSLVHSKLQGQITVHHIDFVLLNESYSGSNETYPLQYFSVTRKGFVIFVYNYKLQFI